MVGQRLRELRKAHGMSQHDLAERTGIHPTAIGRYERDGREPLAGTIIRLARGLGVRPAALLEDPLLRPRERPLAREEFEQHLGWAVSGCSRQLGAR
jgi:transcriptional regulator with XRE-family HTH domain